MTVRAISIVGAVLAALALSCLPGKAVVLYQSTPDLTADPVSVLSAPLVDSFTLANKSVITSITFRITAPADIGTPDFKITIGLFNVSNGQVFFGFSPFLPTIQSLAPVDEDGNSLVQPVGSTNGFGFRDFIVTLPVSNFAATYILPPPARVGVPLVLDAGTWGIDFDLLNPGLFAMPIFFSDSGLVLNGSGDTRRGTSGFILEGDVLVATPLPSALPLSVTGLGALGLLLGWGRKRKTPAG